MKFVGHIFNCIIAILITAMMSDRSIFCCTLHVNTSAFYEYGVSNK